MNDDRLIVSWLEQQAKRTPGPRAPALLVMVTCIGTTIRQRSLEWFNQSGPITKHLATEIVDDREWEPRLYDIRHRSGRRSCAVYPPLIKQEPKQMPDLIDDGNWRVA